MKPRKAFASSRLDPLRSYRARYVRPRFGMSSINRKPSNQWSKVSSRDAGLVSLVRYRTEMDVGQRAD